MILPQNVDFHPSFTDLCPCCGLFFCFPEGLHTPEEKGMVPLNYEISLSPGHVGILICLQQHEGKGLTSLADRLDSNDQGCCS